MVLVTGHAIASKETGAAVERLAVEHVLLSRAEAGCVSHEVGRDVLQPLRFVFVERWSDTAALQAHSRVEPSRAFANAITELCEAGTQVTIYQTEALHTGWRGRWPCVPPPASGGHGRPYHARHSKLLPQPL